MATPIRMPQPGQMTEECTVLQWFKTEGDTIAKGDPLFEIETDKSNMEIEAFDEGTLLRIDAPVGATVPVEAIVAWIGKPGDELPAVEEAPAATGSAAAPTPPAAEAPAPTPAPTPPPAAAAAAPTQPSSGQRRRLAISPRASRLAAELGVDPLSITGSGPNGRIVERDVQAAAAGADASAPAAAPAGETGVSTPAAPPVASEAPSVASQVAAARPANAEGEGEKLSRMRQTIARRLTQNSLVPTFTVTVAVDMTDLLGLRAQLKAAGSGINVTDFIHAATVQALGEYPLLNASTDGTAVWKHEHVHLGVAVSVPEGLLIPVIRDADAYSVAGLHDQTVDLVTRTREGKLGPDQLSGSTFSVSNMGMFGVEQFTATINPGESGILAVSSVTAEPRVFGDGIAVRQMMRITLTADHRLIDGEMGANFTNAIKRRLEDAAAFRDQVPAGA